MKASKNLTHSTIQAAKAKDKPYKLSDSDRLYVLVTTKGKKYWKWNYRLDGKDSTYTFGTFPDIGLAEAREKRIDAEKKVKQGIHPADFDKDQILSSKLNKATTLWSVAEEWIENPTIKRSNYYLRQIRSCMQRYIRDMPIGNRPIKEVTTQEMYNLISSIAIRTKRTGLERKTTGAPQVAINMRTWCNAVFRLAKVSGRLTQNPIADLKISDIISKPTVKNNRALSKTELGKLLAALDEFTGRQKTKIAIELLMLTFVRTGELRCATWGEFDLENALWTIPSARMKIKTSGDHLVPLAPQTIALLKQLMKSTELPISNSSLLFPNERNHLEPMTPTTINRALERMNFNGKGTIGFSAHGFRGTASTMLHELGSRSDVIELQLAHQERNSVKAAYNKAQYLAERKELMERWANHIDTLRPQKK